MCLKKNKQTRNLIYFVILLGVIPLCVTLPECQKLNKIKVSIFQILKELNIWEWCTHSRIRQKKWNKRNEEIQKFSVLFKGKTFKRWFILYV